MAPEALERTHAFHVPSLVPSMVPRSRAPARMSKTLFFQGGTLVLGDTGQQEQVPAPFQWVKGRWRCEGYHYASLLPWLRAQHIRDLVPRWKSLAFPLHDRREPHAYQLE